VPHATVLLICADFTMQTMQFIIVVCFAYCRYTRVRSGPPVGFRWSGPFQGSRKHSQVAFHRSHAAGNGQLDRQLIPYISYDRHELAQKPGPRCSAQRWRCSVQGRIWQVDRGFSIFLSFNPCVTLTTPKAQSWRLSIKR
jgi:hypothetical protein